MKSSGENREILENRIERRKNGVGVYSCGL